MSSNTFKRFYFELQRLEAMVAATQYSFELVRKDIKEQSIAGKIDRNTKVKLLSGSEVLVETSYYAFLNGLDSSYPRYARETTFVRLVSTLEVFLIDVIRDLYLHRLDLFHDQNKRVEVTYGELFSSGDIGSIRNKAIFKELRQLHSGGMREIAKYYQNRVGVNFGSLGVDLAAIWEAVDRRHLLVHALGRADAAYRKAYAYTKKVPLSVGVEYFFAISGEFRRLGKSIEPTIVTLLEEAADDGPKLERAFAATVLLSEMKAEVKRMVRPEFAFVVSDAIDGEKIVRLREFLVDKSDIEGGVEIRLKGEANAVSAYIKLLKVQRKSHAVRMKVTDLKRDRSLERIRSVDASVVQNVKDRLPPRPWPIGIHKTIAADLGISNSLCSRAIDTILREAEAKEGAGG